MGPPTWYLSGPMTGKPDWNFPAFNAAAEYWRGKGLHVINPAENFAGRTDLPRHEYMREDIRLLLTANVIAMLPGWEASKGARLEHAIAKEIGLIVTSAIDGQPLGETILEEAQRLVHGDRQTDYGHPIEDFTRTGIIWGAIIGHRQHHEPVTPEQVAMCMVGVKLSRECHHPKRDNRTDGAGYFATLDMVRQRQEGK